ncbi:hypothetical protein [Cohnella luojiensis]|uniref:Uncharacterized protein n=1 Tax=Cohnella luojiensis TaxID=652876 RepID=A0A4Y8M7P9_9BACL|nr:hypothetical protein [Cohnella luojiensis]TFE30855.1 hypothetical protein E2980_03505 [Cohnella luojiensis]
MDWSESVLLDRYKQISDICDQQTNNNYEGLMYILRKLLSELPDEKLMIYEIENIFNVQTRLVVEKAYLAGLHDGISFAHRVKIS